MLLSMTSYGRSTAALANKSIAIEIKTLNSKFVDLRLRVPPIFQEKEMVLRKVLHDKVLRGKIEATFTFENQEGGENYSINGSIFRQYHLQLSSLQEELKIPDGDLLSSIMRLPEVVSTSEESISDEDWKTIQSTLDAALDKLVAHRAEEGSAIEADLQIHINSILGLLDQVTPFEAERVEKVRQRMSSSLEEYLSRENVDENRFEQEVLFYLEKIDITEEKVRLKQHCNYFLQIMSNKEVMKGRKLNFISQEIGREINTLGAKAYSSDIQKLVVRMKDDLEKIKEQLANVV